MIKDLLRWVAPGVVTVIGGTTAALSMATPSMVDTLTQEGRAVLSTPDMAWANLSISGRDAVLTGTVESVEKRDRATTLLASVNGIERVDDMVIVAPLADPFVFEVKVEDGSVSLSGSVPNSDALQQLSSLPSVAEANLSIRAGAPPEADWDSGVAFAVAQASLVRSGKFSLSGLTLDIEAEAGSQRDFGVLQTALAKLPEGLSIGKALIKPLRVEPYTWSARFDGESIAVSGYVPTEELAETYRVADLSGRRLATGLALASGAPDDFAQRSQLLLEQLARLDSGEATIIDGTSRLTGKPATFEVAQAVTEALSGSGSIVRLDPPVVGDYWVSATLQPGGVTVFDGFVPDEALRQTLSEQEGADVNFLKLGSGASPSFRPGLDFALGLLTHMSEGRVSLRGDTLSVSGLTATSSDYAEVQGLLQDRLPQGLTLGQIDFTPPPAATYTFAMTREADGRVVLSGMLPNAQVEAELSAALGENTRSDVSYATGQPANFAASIERARALLALLERGSIAFDGAGWTVSGTPRSAIDAAAIETDFTVQRLAQAGWLLDLESPAPAAQVSGPDQPVLPDAPEVSPDETVETAAAEEPVTSTPDSEPQPTTQPSQSAEPAVAVEPRATAVDPDALAQCRAQVAELSAHNAILFQSGAAIIADSASTELDAFAAALAQCPGSSVFVEGHTDSDGDDRKNLALSVARAEAVVSALIERGVEAGRLYAIGYGESQPVADNATADGKRQNRRIVVSVSDGND